MKIHVTIEVNPRSWRRRRRLFVVGAAVLAVAIPAAVWASHDFIDVPTSHQFHSQISAIKGAGITVGCAPDTYCPDNFVRRDEMAAFMHRGFTRLGWFAFSATITATSDSDAAAVASDTITVGLPSSALPGAVVFLEGHVAMNIVAPASGCPCEYRAMMTDVTDGEPFTALYARVTVDNSEVGHLTVSGAIDTPISGVHTIQLRVFRFSGTGTGATAEGDATLTYHPFGSMGTNSLGTSGSPAGSSDARTSK
jgi:hypothetical protein